MAPRSSVTREACDACRRRKVKCSGGKPCSNCTESELSCTSLLARRKGGRSGLSANVLHALKTAQTPPFLSTSSSSPPSSADHITSAPRGHASHKKKHQSPPKSGSTFGEGFVRAHDLLSDDLVERCMDYFFAKLGGTVPILHRETFQRQVENTNCSLNSYCLVVAFCAFVLVQTGGGVTLSPQSQPQPRTPTAVHSPVLASAPVLKNESEEQTPDLEYGRSLLNEATEARKHLELFTAPARQSILTSFFFYGSHIGLGNQRHAYFYLREATTLYTSGVLDLSLEEDAEHPSVAGKLFWLLLVSERAHAIRRHRPVTLQITPDSPGLDERSDIDMTTISFRYLVNLYRPFDETFLGLWNGTHTSCSADMLVWLEEHILNAVPQDPEIPDVQLADLRVSQQWLRTMIWQLAISLGFLSSNSSQKCLGFRHPLQIARDLAFATWKLPVESMASHGVGLIEKVFDVACTLTDVMSFLPADEVKSSGFELGPQDYLNHFFSLICTLRGGRRRFLPLLLTKVAQTFPSMVQPIAQHLRLEPAPISSGASSASTQDTPPPCPPSVLRQLEGAPNPVEGPTEEELGSGNFNYADISRIGDKTPEIAKVFLHYTHL